MYQIVIKYALWHSYNKIFVNDNEGSVNIQDAYLFESKEEAEHEINTYDDSDMWEIVIVDITYNYKLQHKAYKYNDLYLDYIYLHGHCGYHGISWKKHQTDCSKCHDSNGCGRYKILNNIEIKYL